MTDYSVNEDAVRNARKLIDDGKFDDETPWSKAAPSADEANSDIDKDGFDDFARWHLGVDTSASEGTKGRYAFPYGDFAKVNRAALIHAKQRASQNGHDKIEKVAGELLDHLDSKRS